MGIAAVAPFADYVTASHDSAKMNLRNWAQSLPELVIMTSAARRKAILTCRGEGTTGCCTAPGTGRASPSLGSDRAQPTTIFIAYGAVLARGRLFTRCPRRHNVSAVLLPVSFTIRNQDAPFTGKLKLSLLSTNLPLRRELCSG